MRLIEVAEPKKPQSFSERQKAARDKTLRQWELSKWGDDKVTPGADPLRFYFGNMFMDAFKQFPNAIQNREAGNYNLGVGGNSILDTSPQVDEQFEDFIDDETPEGWYELLTDWAGFLVQLQQKLTNMEADLKRFRAIHGTPSDRAKFIKAHKAIKGIAIKNRHNDRLFTYVPHPDMETIVMTHEGKELSQPNTQDPLIRTWKNLKRDNGWMDILESSPKWMKIVNIPGPELTPEEHENWGLDRLAVKEKLAERGKEAYNALSKLIPGAKLKKGTTQFYFGDGKHKVHLDFHEARRDRKSWDQAGIDAYVSYPKGELDWADEFRKIIEGLGYKHQGREERGYGPGHRGSTVYEDLYELDL